MAAPIGRAAKPTNWVEKEARAPANSDCSGKKTFGNTRAAAVPYRKKSYHSMVVPTVLATTARRRCVRIRGSAALVVVLMVRPSVVVDRWLSPVAQGTLDPFARRVNAGAQGADALVQVSVRRCR